MTQLRFDPRGATTKTGELVGWNLGRGTLYAPHGDTRHPEWRTPERVAAVQALSRICGPRTPRMRFSGLQIDGAFGNDGYHFRKYVEAPPEATDMMAPSQFMALIDEAKARAIITLNFATGTPSEAAEYVQHLLGMGVELDELEIGNEVYGIWNTGYVEDPRVFALRAIEYVDAVCKVFPKARFHVPFAQASMDAWGGIDAAIAGLEPLLVLPSIASVVVHHYLVDDALMFGFEDKSSAALVMSGMARFEPEYVRLQRALAPFPHVGIGVTEYHVAGAFSRGQFPRGEQAIVGLGILEMLMAFARIGVVNALQHLALAFDVHGDLERDVLIEPWYNPLAARAGEVSPRPTYVATSFFAEHARERTMPITLVGAPRGRLGSFEHDLVHAVGFTDDTSATLLIANRDLQRAHAVEIETVDGLLMDNVQCLAPHEVEDVALHTSTTTMRVSAGVTTTELPPHSVLAVRWRR